jgi:hypothetical protein
MAYKKFHHLSQSSNIMLSPRNENHHFENFSFCSFANFNPIVLHVISVYKRNNVSPTPQQYNYSKVVLRTFLPNVVNFKSFISPNNYTCLAVYLPISFKTPCYLCYCKQSYYHTTCHNTKLKFI